jgi:hypothetical protein
MRMEGYQKNHWRGRPVSTTCSSAIRAQAVLDTGEDHEQRCIGVYPGHKQRHAWRPQGSTCMRFIATCAFISSCARQQTQIHHCHRAKLRGGAIAQSWVFMRRLGWRQRPGATAKRLSARLQGVNGGILPTRCIAASENCDLTVNRPHAGMSLSLFFALQGPHFDGLKL